MMERQSKYAYGIQVTMFLVYFIARNLFETKTTKVLEVLLRKGNVVVTSQSQAEFSFNRKTIESRGRFRYSMHIA